MKLTAALLLGAVALSAQQPSIQNGQVEPVWVGWREAAAPGIVSDCSAVLEGSNGLNSGAVFAIGQHRDDSVDALIALAKQNLDNSARTAAINAIGRSKNPKAMAFIDGILKR